MIFKKPAPPVVINRDPVTGRFLKSKTKLQREEYVRNLNTIFWALVIIITLFYGAMLMMLFFITQSLRHIESNHMYGPAEPYTPEPVIELTQPEPIEFPIEVKEEPRPLIKVIRGSVVSYE